MTLDNFNISFLKVQPAIVDFMSWAFSVLIWGNALTLLAQVDIPKEAWGQYPLLLLGAIVTGWVTREWVKNEREWREFTTKQVQDKEAANLAILKLIQDGHKDQVAIIEKHHQEQLQLQRAGLEETFDTNLERVLDALAKTNGNQPKRGRSNGPA